MSIQIPVENAKYAFAADSENARIGIRIAEQADAVRIEIEDNGIGYNMGEGAFNERGTGNGLRLMRRTAELLNMRNQKQMTFDIEEKGQGTTGTKVVISVPLEYRFEM